MKEFIHKNSCPIAMSQKGEWAASIPAECNCVNHETCISREKAREKFQEALKLWRPYFYRKEKFKEVLKLYTDCPERKSICCGAERIAVEGDEGTGWFACKNCLKFFFKQKTAYEMIW